MKIDSISINLLKLIVTSKKVSVNQIMSELNIAKGSIYPRFSKINYWLKIHNLNELYSNEHGQYSIHPSDINEVINILDEIKDEYILQPRERIDNLLIYIITSKDKVDIIHLNQLNGVSRNTSLNDIKNATLHHHSINIKYDKKLGYQIIGDELAIRNLAFEIIQHNLHCKIQFIQSTIKSQLHSTFNRNNFDYFSSFTNFIDTLQQKINHKFTDKDYKLFLYLLYVFALRRKKNACVNFTEQQTLWVNNQKNIHIINDSIEPLTKDLDIDCAFNEQYYISLLLMVSKGIRIFDIQSPLEQKLKSVISMMVTDFERLSGLYFQERDRLLRQLFSHLRPAIIRALFKIKTINVLKDEVYNHYPLILDAVKIVIQSLEHEFDISFSDDELCYIAMNFASFLANQNKSNSNQNKPILLITEGGVSSTHLLESQLLKLSFNPITIKSISVSELDIITNFDDYFFVITTSQMVHIPENIKTVYVHHILSSSQQIKIKMLLEGKDYSWLLGGLAEKIAHNLAEKSWHEDQIKVHVNQLIENEIKQGLLFPRQSTDFVLTDLAKNDQIIDTANHWDDVIDIAGQPFIANQHIDQRYLESIKKSIKQYGQYMYLADNIFLLHTSPEYNLKQSSAISLLKINQFKLIDDKPALVFLLVTSQNGDQIDILKKLNQLLSDEVWIENIMKADNLTSLQRQLTTVYSN